MLTLGDDLIGTRYTHLFQPPSASKPQVFAAKYVTASSGTGLVHTAPAHGQEDYEAFRTAFPESFSVNLTSPQLRCPVDDDGKFTKALVGWATDQAAAERLVGLSVLGDGVGAVIDMLRTDGCLLAQEEIEHRYPCDWKTKEPIIIR
jgi:isoleucyl-tRNA synthetase